MSTKTPAGPTRGQPRDSFPKTPFRATITTKGEPCQTLTGEIVYLGGVDKRFPKETFGFQADGALRCPPFYKDDWLITPEVQVPTKAAAVILDVGGDLLVLKKHGGWRWLDQGSPASLFTVGEVLRHGGRVLFEGYDEEAEK